VSQLPALRQSELPVNAPSPSSASLAEQLAAAMAAIHRRGWCEGTGGNFSCVLQWQPLRLLMAPSGVDKGSLLPEQLIVVDDQGEVLRGSGRASAETELHLALVQSCGAGAVLHTHSQSGTLLSQHYAPRGTGVAQLSLQDLEMLKGLEGVNSHTCRVDIPVLDNDQDLRRLRSAAEPHLAAAPFGLLIAGHGLYAWGKDLGSALRHLEILEFLLEQHWRQLLLQALAPPSPRLQLSGLRWILLDIEGTTCPVSFVARELFPYAADHMGALLLARQGDPEIQALLAELETIWSQDTDPAAQALRQKGPADVLPYLRWLISEDRKLTPLKELQGLVWEQGYRSGALRGPLYADVPAALRRWRSAGLRLAVYSSGSVAAQQLIFGYSNAGDLRPLFGGWFDTRSGLKQEEGSYRNITAQLGVRADQVLFISDANAECQAAASAGMQVLFSYRDGNPEHSSGKFDQISSFDELCPST